MSESAPSSKKQKFTSEVDCEMANRGVWLVKVPKYLSDLWEANSGSDVGRILINSSSPGKMQLKLKSRPGMIQPVREEVPFL